MPRALSQEDRRKDAGNVGGGCVLSAEFLKDCRGDGGARQAPSSSAAEDRRRLILIITCGGSVSKLASVGLPLLPLPPPPFPSPPLRLSPVATQCHEVAGMSLLAVYLAGLRTGVLGAMVGLFSPGIRGFSMQEKSCKQNVSPRIIRAHRTCAFVFLDCHVFELLQVQQRSKIYTHI